MTPRHPYPSFARLIPARWWVQAGGRVAASMASRSRSFGSRPGALTMALSLPFSVGGLVAAALTGSAMAQAPAGAPSRHEVAEPIRVCVDDRPLWLQLGSGPGCRWMTLAQARQRGQISLSGGALLPASGSGSFRAIEPAPVDPLSEDPYLVLDDLGAVGTPLGWLIADQVHGNAAIPDPAGNTSPGPGGAIGDHPMMRERSEVLRRVGLRVRVRY